MDKIEKTMDYDQFIFRDDNRHKIMESHIELLVESIQQRNLLDVHPILVNEAFEVIDGQNRLKAAQRLGLPIYYIQKEGLVATDVIVMNVQKSWILEDYLNFYRKNDYPEYKKLESFINQFRLSVTVGLKITCGKTRQALKDFRAGKFVLNFENLDKELEICLDVIDYLKRIKGFCQWTTTAKFWSALLRMIRSKDFNEAKWKINLRKMIERVEQKISEEDYLKMFVEVHNWHNDNKITMESLHE